MTVVPATCTAAGCKTVKCSRCEATDVTVLTAPGHDFDESIEANVTVVPATCTVDGSKTVKCSCCDETKATVLPAPGHGWGAWAVVTPATETEKGKEQRVCGRCGETQEREILPEEQEDPTPAPTVHCRCFENLLQFFLKILNLFGKMFRTESIC